MVEGFVPRLDIMCVIMEANSSSVAMAHSSVSLHLSAALTLVYSVMLSLRAQISYKKHEI